MENEFWRKCGNCKKEINYGQTYQRCSISSCRKHAYCSVDCWSVHSSVMGHMSAYAEEETAPRVAPDKDNKEHKRRRIIVSAPKSSPSSKSNEYDRDILIVASKLKKYVKDRHDLNTSANVMDKLSDIVREVTDRAVENALKDERKTLMDRDF